MTSDSNRDCYTKHVTPGIVVTGTKQNQNSNENNHGRYFNWADNAQWDEVFGGSFYSGKTYDVKVCRDKSEIYDGRIKVFDSSNRGRHGRRDPVEQRRSSGVGENRR